MTRISCPDAQLLSRLLTGELDEAEAEPLEEHLCQCSVCAARAEGLPVDAPLLQDMRRWAQEGTRIPVSPPVHQLIDRLRELPLRASPTALMRQRSLELAPGVARSPVVARSPDAVVARSPDRATTGEASWPHTGRYRLLRILGHGGMGTVYLAEDPQLGRQVAVKVPHFGLASEAETVARQRFLREAQFAAGVSHPNVCPIYDVGEDQDGPYVVLAYIEGGSLAGRLKDQQRWDDPRQAVALAAQVADGLAAIHARGVIHRDLKPGNILLDGKGIALLTDFGLARGQDTAQQLTVTGTVVGTPAYMAPEQLTSDLALDHRCDLYSLGVVLYQMLTGRLPFEGPEPHRLLYQIVHASPPPLSARRPDLGPDLEALVSKAMARRPQDRFQTAGDLAGALRDWLQQTEARGSPSQALPHFVPAPAAAPAPAVKAVPSRKAQLRRLRWQLLCLALLLGAWMFFLTGRKHDFSDRTSLLAGQIEIKVWPSRLDNATQVSIRDAGVLPLGPEDELELIIDFNRPAYAYVIRFDSTARPTPVYPWQDQQWDQWPEKEVPTDKLWLPGGGARWATNKGPAGLETVLVLARETPLPRTSNLDLRLPPLDPIPLKGSRPLAFFQNWRLVEDNRLQNLASLAGMRPNDAPLIRAQQMLKQRLGEYFDFSSAILFSFAGTPPRADKPWAGGQ